jgi:hypothetical protein
MVRYAMDNPKRLAQLKLTIAAVQKLMALTPIGQQLEYLLGVRNNLLRTYARLKREAKVPKTKAATSRHKSLSMH